MFSVISIFSGLRSLSRRWSVLLLCAMLAACTTPFKAETTVFHQWPNHTASGLVFRFAIPAAGEQTLERAAYENVLRQILVAKGFRESPEASYLLSFNYSSHDVRRIVGSDMWASGSVWGGTMFSRGGFMLGGSMPLGVYPPREVLYSERVLTVLINDEKTAQHPRLYEGKASAVDAGRDALAALPYLVRALFEDFPGPSGATREVQIPLGR